MKIQGASTALVTPWTEDDVFDADAWAKIVTRQIEGGIDGLVVAGTTGESPNITDAEKQRATEIALELSAGRVPVVVGTGTNSTAASVDATKLAKQWGADAALVVCPYYNKPTQEGMFRHFKAVYEAAGLPVIAYNVPGRTASDLLPETIARLVEIGAIVAVKDATADMTRAAETLAAVDPSKPFALMSGDDFTILPFVASGGAGVVSVVSNLVPGDTSRLVTESAAGNWEVARPLNAKIIELSRTLFEVSNPIPVKAGAAMLGLCRSQPRLPLVDADDAVNQSVRQAMLRYGGLLG
jgi:4-hydroxy-tetrahydrodipicolinate synthase